MTLTRTIDQWRNLDTDAILAWLSSAHLDAGSFAQVLLCISDAHADILALHAEVDRLRKIDEAAQVQYEAYSAWSGLADVLNTSDNTK